ncbi:MAG: hypothetical protein HW405_144 [Candidatus Berkelbacteria bacterium]|nr:hypothetical protein [Candidatus Berkelbacteria bacterium]
MIRIYSFFGYLTSMRHVPMLGIREEHKIHRGRSTFPEKFSDNRDIVVLEAVAESINGKKIAIETSNFAYKVNKKNKYHIENHYPRAEARDIFKVKFSTLHPCPLPKVRHAE